MNRKVVVIISDQEYKADNMPFPPIGTVGVSVSGMDADGEYDIVFDDFPCPVPPDISWVVHRTMIAFLDEDLSELECNTTTGVLL